MLEENVGGCIHYNLGTEKKCINQIRKTKDKIRKEGREGVRKRR